MSMAIVDRSLGRAKYAVGRRVRKYGIAYSNKAAVQIWRERGDEFSAQGKVEQAVRCRRRAVALDPANIQLRVELVRELVRAGRGAEATDAAAWHALADHLLTGDDCIEAERAYRAVLALTPSAYDAFLGLAECLVRQQRLDEVATARDAWFRHWIAAAASDDLRRRQDDARRRGIPGIAFVAMMKSASEFIHDNLLRALEAPEILISIGTVPRDRLIDAAVRRLATGGAVSRSHISSDNLPALVANGVNRLVLHVRDPRQVTVSWTHHMRRLGRAEFRHGAATYDPPLPAAFRDWPLRRQLDWAVENYLPGQLQWLEDWAAALDRHRGAVSVLVSTFEEFRADQDAFFRRVADFFGLAEFQVPGLSDQSAAAMRNFRLGHVDEWRTVLSAEQLKAFRARFEPVAERFGWEVSTPAARGSRGGIFAGRGGRRPAVV